jgi:Cupredoxin-like domain
MLPRFSVLPGVLLVVLAGCGNESPGIPVTLKDHRFTPAEIHVKANEPALITLTNQDGAAEEFDSTALKVEKVVPGHETGNVRLRPLAAGRYPFMGEYHSDTAQGVVVAE